MESERNVHNYEFHIPQVEKTRAKINFINYPFQITNRQTGTSQHRWFLSILNNLEASFASLILRTKSLSTYTYSQLANKNRNHLQSNVSSWEILEKGYSEVSPSRICFSLDLAYSLLQWEHDVPDQLSLFLLQPWGKQILQQLQGCYQGHCIDQCN